jgi:hypothetical protein
MVQNSLILIVAFANGEHERVGDRETKKRPDAAVL